MGWLGSIAAFLVGLVGWGRDKDTRANSPEMVANKKAAEDAKTRDHIAALESAAAAGDAKATEELRKLISEE